MKTSEITLGSYKGLLVNDDSAEALIRSEGWNLSWATQPDVLKVLGSMGNEMTVEYPVPIVTNTAHVIGEARNGVPLSVIVHGISSIIGLSGYIAEGHPNPLGIAYPEPCCYFPLRKDFDNLVDGNILPVLSKDDLKKDISVSRYAVVLDRFEAVRSLNARYSALRDGDSGNVMLQIEAGGQGNLEEFLSLHHDLSMAAPFSDSIFLFSDYRDPLAMIVETGFGLGYSPVRFKERSNLLKNMSAVEKPDDKDVLYQDSP